MSKQFTQSEKEEIKRMRDWGVRKSELKEMFGCAGTQLDRILDDDPNEPTLARRVNILNENIVRNVRRLHREGWTRREIQTETGLGYSTVRSIIKRQRWKDVE